MSGFGRYSLAALLLTMLVFMAGCGSGGGGSAAAGAGKKASLSVVQSREGEFAIQGNNMDGVASMEIGISYANMNGPSVVAGAFIGGAGMSVSTPVYGVINISIHNAEAFAGSGQIAMVLFDAGLIGSTIVIDYVRMYDAHGNQL